MAGPKRPWGKLTPAERIEAVRPLEAANRANSTIAFELKAPRTDINRICTFLRRERHAAKASIGSQSGAELPVAPAPHLGVSPAGRDSDESPVFNPEAKTSEDNGATVLADTPSDPANSVTGEASRVDAGRTASATSETMDATAGETARNHQKRGVVTGAVVTAGKADKPYSAVPPLSGGPSQSDPPPNREPSEPESPTRRSAIEDVPPLVPDLLRAVSRPNWHTTDRETRDGIVLRLRGEGLSNSQIAARFTDCPSRSAVAGIFNRLRQQGSLTKAPPRPKALKADRAPARTRQARPKAERAPKQNLHAGNIVRKAASRQFDPGEIALPLNRAAAYDPLPGTVPVPFGSSGCKWSVDGLEGRGLLWCGLPRDTRERADEPYCVQHGRIAYTAPAARPRRASASPSAHREERAFR